MTAPKPVPPTARADVTREELSPRAIEEAERAALEAGLAWANAADTPTERIDRTKLVDLLAAFRELARLRGELR